jgi:hypothetical protein
MPRKPKPRQTAAFPDKVWIAPRPPSASEFRTSDKVWIAPRPAGRSGFSTVEPADLERSNRYLEFADIALGVKDTRSPRKNPAARKASPDGIETAKVR